MKENCLNNIYKISISKWFSSLITMNDLNRNFHATPNKVCFILDFISLSPSIIIVLLC